MSAPYATPWYALHVRSRHEKTVHAQLQAKQQDVFLPLYSVQNKWADRWKTVCLPLFPGYVFCRFDVADRSSVLATSGVIDIVRAGSEPAAIEDSEIEAVQLIVNSRVPAEPYADLATGQRVMMTGGPLNGLTGTLASIRNTVRLVVSIELLCRSVLVEIDREWVIPCEMAHAQFFRS
jgi:transcription antitermination factor NusG